MSSLNRALFAFRYPCFSVYLCSAITLSFYSSSFPLYLGNLIMSPTWQISLVVLSMSKMLPWVISVSCLLFKDLTQCLIYILIPSLSYLLSLVSPLLCPVPSHSCDPLEDLLPSLSQYSSASALSDDKDLDFLTIVPQDSLSLLVSFFALVVNYHILVDNLLNPLHVRLQQHLFTWPGLY